jgi:hypothetical protein
MAKVRVTFIDGRSVDGEITDKCKAAVDTPALLVEGQAYSGMDAVGIGISVEPVTDPNFDRWLSTFRL